MRSYLLLTVVAALPAVLAAPVADSAVARSANNLAVRDADAAVIKAEVRQLPDLPLPLNDILKQVTDALGLIPELVGDVLELVVSLVNGLLSGNPLDPAALSKLSAAPTELLAKVLDTLTKIVAEVPVLGPLLAPLLGVLTILTELGSGLIPVARDLGARQLPGLPALPLPLGDLLGNLTAALQEIPELGEDVLQLVLDLVTGLLSGKPLDPSKISKLLSQPAFLLAKILAVLTKIVAGLPVVGLLLAPLLAGLTLVVSLAGIVVGGVVGRIVWSVADSQAGAAGGVVGGAAGLA